MPYYLHVLDKVQGAAHFMVDEEARAIMRELLTLVSGYMVPRLAREIGGEPSKTPLDLGLATVKRSAGESWQTFDSQLTERAEIALPLPSTGEARNQISSGTYRPGRSFRWRSAQSSTAGSASGCSRHKSRYRPSPQPGYAGVCRAAHGAAFFTVLPGHPVALLAGRGPQQLAIRTRLIFHKANALPA
jgi:hypothetical protein